MPIYALGDLRPTIAPGAFIAPDANIIGNVTIEEGASVWFGVTIRGDNEPIVVGKGSNVQEDCVFHTDPGCPLTIGENCTIGHKAMLHGCTVGNGALIGMGATVLNRAVIGPGSLVGACALVTEGKTIPAGSLVMGSPAKVVRELDAAAREGLLASAAHYTANGARFRAELTQL